MQASELTRTVSLEYADTTHPSCIEHSTGSQYICLICRSACEMVKVDGDSMYRCNAEIHREFYRRFARG